MTVQYREIDVSPYREAVGVAFNDAGPLPELKWLPISSLVVDPRYQREVGRAGEKNVIKIAKGFRWRKFGVVIVAPIGDGRYAIVDGQHRTLGTAARGFEMVPCMIIAADEREQADAFTAINGNVTLMTPLQIHAARVASGDLKAIALEEACRDGDVTICRYPVPGNKMKPGETLAVTVLRRQLELYGAPLLSLALRCITRTRDGNPGMVRAQVIKALCTVLDSEPALSRNPARLIAAMEGFDFEAEFDRATAGARQRKSKIDVVFVANLFEFLSSRLMGKAA